MKAGAGPSNDMTALPRPTPTNLTTLALSQIPDESDWTQLTHWLIDSRKQKFEIRPPSLSPMSRSQDRLLREARQSEEVALRSEPQNSMTTRPRLHVAQPQNAHSGRSEEQHARSTPKEGMSRRNGRDDKNTFALDDMSSPLLEPQKNLTSAEEVPKTATVPQQDLERAEREYYERR